MKMTHVIRGEAHIMNTPKHIQLFEAFGVTPPVFAHMPLILNQDGSKMSKRDVGAALGTYPEEGFLPEGVMNFLALLGWSPKDDTEIFSPQELIGRFSLEAVNQQHIIALPAEEFALRARPFCLKAGLPDSPILDAAIATVQTKVQTLAEVPDKIRFFFDLGMDPEAVSKVQPEALELLFKLADRLEQEPEWDGHELIGVLKAFAKENGVKMGAVMFPARVALTGLSGGPDLSSVFSLLGREETVRRIRSFSLD